jgi:5-methylcytosine-specific restriction endonuclease McrA
MDNRKNKVLALSKNWQPVRIVTGFSAISKVFVEKALIIDKDFMSYDFDEWLLYCEEMDFNEIPEEKLLRSSFLTILIPEIIVYTEHNGFRDGTPRISRTGVLNRDDHTCQYCGIEYHPSNLNMDHVFPKSKGGKTTWENIVCSCIPCNHKKDNRTPDEAKMNLMRDPKIPHWVDIVIKKGERKNMPKSWGPFFKNEK